MVKVPDTGSVLVVGHNPLGAFVLRAAQVEASVPLVGATLLDCEEEAEIVEVLEACDDSEEDEFWR